MLNMATCLPRVKGQLLIARFDYLRERHGMQALVSVLEALAAQDRDELRGLVREAWYPFGLLMRLDHALGHLLAGGDPAFFEELGLHSALHRTEWLGEHAPLVSVHAFLARVAEEHRRFHDFGRAVCRRTGFHSAELLFSDYPEVDQTFCRSSRGYFRGVLRLLTGQPGEVDEVDCQSRGDRSCLFRLRWRPQEVL
jgi:hypothetical protein